jgi:hypothetical protein
MKWLMVFESGNHFSIFSQNKIDINGWRWKTLFFLFIFHRKVYISLFVYQGILRVAWSETWNFEKSPKNERMLYRAKFRGIRYKSGLFELFSIFNFWALHSKFYDNQESTKKVYHRIHGNFFHFCSIVILLCCILIQGIVFVDILVQDTKRQHADKLERIKLWKRKSIECTTQIMCVLSKVMLDVVHCVGTLWRCRIVTTLWKRPYWKGNDDFFYGGGTTKNV